MFFLHEFPLKQRRWVVKRIRKLVQTGRPASRTHNLIRRHLLTIGPNSSTGFATHSSSPLPTHAVKLSASDDPRSSIFCPRSLKLEFHISMPNKSRRDYAMNFFLPGIRCVGLPNATQATEVVSVACFVFNPEFEIQDLIRFRLTNDGLFRDFSKK
jgi:hypothetical protein